MLWINSGMPDGWAMVQLHLGVLGFKQKLNQLESEDTCLLARAQ